MRIRHEDRRRAGGGELPDGPARPRDGDVGRGEHVSEVVGLRHQQVVGPVHAGSERGVVALAGDVQDRGAFITPRGDRHLVERRRPGERAEHGNDRRLGIDAEARPRLGAARAEVGRRDRPADDLDLVACPPLDLVGEEQLRGERRGKPVGEAEMRVGLGQRCRDPAQPGGEHHRAGDVAAAAEDDIGAPTAEDGATGERCLDGAHERAHELSDGLRGKPLISNVSSSKPASGTSRDSTRSGLPANVTVAPRARSASPTASAGLM